MLQRGASYRAIQAATGLSNGTISKLSKGNLEPDWTIVADLERDERNKLTVLVDRLVDAAMDPERIASAKLSEVGTALNVAMHSRQLAAGRPTSISEFRHLSVQDLLKMREEMLQKAGITGARDITPEPPLLES